VEELRDHGADDRRVRVEVAADGSWVPPGAEVVSRDGRGIVLALRDGTTPDAVLDAARSAGSVTHFSLERPTLTELFREAVAA
jgi:ABC-2 type transport system ATP-binding protein